MSQPARTRDPIAGPDTPEAPFPLKLSGKVIKGFGRGSKELGIPTANIPVEGLSIGGHEDLQDGVYYGWAALDFHSAAAASAGAQHQDQQQQHASFNVAEEDEHKHRVHPMVMSIGWNPFYKNTVRSVEVHIMHDFTHDFYGSHMNLLIAGFIRPELDYVSKEKLIEDIRTDIEVAGRSLARPAYAKMARDPYLKQFPKDGEGRSLKADVAS
ncbi:riboflavin kinase [Saccharata proteae CBS 121410]|uniref:Riboflavin kinase n=1 Tax=Saccharata proteae CBS 121410 TaxID=1314787 RepID=A0A9P4I1T4_9PEZI|nr:riboflavin kinase [Saccharata proteae CBS 121410]